MKRSSIALIAATVLAVSAIVVTSSFALMNYRSVPQTTTKQVARPKAELATRPELLKLMNAERAKVGVPALTEDARLDRSAQRKATDMATYKYEGHVSPHDGRHGYTYVFDEGMKCSYASENLASIQDPGTMTTSIAINGWMHSKLHREAMLNTNYAYVGFGIEKNNVVAHFCEV